MAAPVSSRWTGPPSVHIGPATGLRPWHDAWFDPAAGRLTALRGAGAVTLAVVVNGVKATATITLRPPG